MEEGRLLEFLDSMSREDLADLDREIDAAANRLARLKDFRRLLGPLVVRHETAEDEESDGVTPPPETKKKPQRTRGNAPTDSGTASSEAVAAKREAQTARRLAVAQYLRGHGPTRIMALADALKIPDGSISSVISYEWFERGQTGVELTTAGHQMLKSRDGGADQD